MKASIEDIVEVIVKIKTDLELEIQPHRPISYKIIVTQSLINNLNGQFEEAADNKVSDVLDNSYDPARAL